MTKKLSWKDRYATPKQITIKVRMFDGEAVDFQLRRLTGADELAEAGVIMNDVVTQLREIDTPKDEDVDITKTMEVIPKVEVLLAKLVKRVLVIDEADAKSMTDEDWVQFVRNAGGVSGKLMSGLTSAIGLSAGVRGANDLRF